MERMTDYKPQERQDLEELYRKQNVRIYELEQCNLNLQEWLDNKEKVNKSLREENKNLNIKVASLEGEIKGLNSVIEKLHKEIEEQEAEGGGLFDEIDYRKREAKRLGWKPNK